MKRDEAIQLVQQTFNQPYDKSRFRMFIKNLLPDLEDRDQVITGQFIWESFREEVVSYERIGKFIQSDQILDVLAVKLKRSSQLENARTMQRNFIARYLNGGRGGDLRDAALVAFYSEDSEDWRFSLIKMDYSLDLENNKIKKELTPARRFSFLVGPNERIHTASERLSPLFNEHTTLSIAALEDAFNIEVVTKEFFDKYRDLYQKIKGELDYLVENTANIKTEFEAKHIDTDNFAKRLLGQIVFLYFLQKKGWLGVQKGQPWGSGPKNFLNQLFERKLVDYHNFFNDILEPLFYEALATERDDHFYQHFNCRIPFLNGGLFEPIKQYDWVNVDITLDNNRFKEIFETFNLYNFTVREDEPLETEVAVDPEMLGNVFEKLMSEIERGKSGAFYTPKAVVHYMCQQSLINYLDTELNTIKKPIKQTAPQQKHLFAASSPKQEELFEEVYEEQVSRSDIEKFIHLGDLSIENERNIAQKGAETKTYRHQVPETIRGEAARIDNFLATIRILDPAIGSGAFPVGMMNEIVRARLSLNALVGQPNRSPFELKWHCIQQSLYGVDVNASAVDIAKLRLWLSLVVEEDNFNDIKPLPNLDYKIRTGDSLIGFTVDVSRNYLNLLEQLPPLKKAFFSETRPSEKDRLREQIERLLQSKYKNSKGIEGIQVTFEPRLEFLEVFEENGGFDIVIANPPYVRQEKIKELKEILKARYKNVYKGTADLLVYFYELAYTLLRPNGCLTFISSNKFMRAGYGDKLRSFLSQQTRLCQLVDFGDLPVFQDIAAYPLIVISQKQKPHPHSPYSIKTLTATTVSCLKNLEKYIEDNAQNITATQLGSSEWHFAVDGGNLKTKVTNKSIPLKNRIDNKILSGIKTGFNSAFIIPEALAQEFISVNPASKQVIRRYLEGNNLKRWIINDTKTYLICIKNGWTDSKRGKELPEQYFKRTYPEIYEYLKKIGDEHQKRLDSGEKLKSFGLYKRDAQGKYWWELRPCSYYEEFEKAKILIPDISKENNFVLDNLGYYPDMTAFVIASDDLSLLAILNSSVTKWFFQCISPSVRGGYFRYKKPYLAQIPIPLLTTRQKEQLAGWAKQLLDLQVEPNNSNRAASIFKLENNINQLLYEFYELTSDEIITIKEAVYC